MPMHKHSPTTTALKCLHETKRGGACGAYGVRGELDGRRVLAAADAAVALHLTAEQLPATVQLCVGPVALCLWRDGGTVNHSTLQNKCILCQLAQTPKNAGT